MSESTGTPGGTRPVVHVPERLEELLGFSAECGCGRVHSVDLVHATIRRGALEDLVRYAAEVGRGLVLAGVADRVTREVAGRTAERVLTGAGHRTRWCIVPDGAGGRPHADEHNALLVESALRGADLALAVGSGTINDLTKLASHRCGIPYISVATAPSMNGYTSAMAAVTVRGVKRTLDCRQPYAVVADLDVLCGAPRHLMAAGLGDLESKPTATADFRLGGVLRNAYYCSAPERVVFAAEAEAAQSADGLARGDPEAVAALTEALVLSGISMKLAGSSSPASGGEHLISHHWDMTAAEEGRVEGWHGAQVGVCSIVMAALYERLAGLSPAEIDIAQILSTRPTDDELRQQLRERHGSRADEVAAEYFAKHLSDAELRTELSYLLEHWKELWESLTDALRSPGQIRRVLQLAGAPVRASDLGLTPDHLRRSFVAAREIRGRFTVLDLAADLGLLERVREEVLPQSGCLW